MKKVIGIILIIIISLVILTGCTSESSAVTEERFIYIGDGIGISDVYYDRETRVQYLYHSHYQTGAFFTVLLDAEGKPLLYQGE